MLDPDDEPQAMPKAANAPKKRSMRGFQPYSNEPEEAQDSPSHHHNNKDYDLMNFFNF